MFFIEFLEVFRGHSVASLLSPCRHRVPSLVWFEPEEEEEAVADGLEDIEEEGGHSGLSCVLEVHHAEGDDERGKCKCFKELELFDLFEDSESYENSEDDDSCLDLEANAAVFYFHGLFFL